MQATPKTAIATALLKVEALRAAAHLSRSGIGRHSTHQGVSISLKQSSSPSSVFRNEIIKPRLVDLGSGDGRVCILAAQQFGYSAVGIEVYYFSCALSIYTVRI